MSGNGTFFRPQDLLAPWLSKTTKPAASAAGIEGALSLPPTSRIQRDVKRGGDSRSGAISHNEGLYWRHLTIIEEESVNVGAASGSTLTRTAGPFCTA